MKTTTDRQRPPGLRRLRSAWHCYGISNTFLFSLRTEVLSAHTTRLRCLYGSRCRVVSIVSATAEHCVLLDDLEIREAMHLLPLKGGMEDAKEVKAVMDGALDKRADAVAV